MKRQPTALPRETTLISQTFRLDALPVLHDDEEGPATDPGPTVLLLDAQDVESVPSSREVTRFFEVRAAGEPPAAPPPPVPGRTIPPPALPAPQPAPVPDPAWLLAAFAAGVLGTMASASVASLAVLPLLRLG